MPSAACYTNKRRVIAEASLTKVQYPRQIAVQNTLLPTENCSRNFATLNYIFRRCCSIAKPVVPPSPLGCILDGNGPGIILDGNGPGDILDGNGSC